MNKQLVIAGIGLLVIGGGGFFVWQNGKDVRELNKNLPEGVSVAKSLFGSDYKVVNKVDGYEFNIPQEWQGISEIEYIPEEEREGYLASKVEVLGKDGVARIAILAKFQQQDQASLEGWAENYFKAFELVGSFSKEMLHEKEIVKAKDVDQLMGMHVYFFGQDSTIYALINGSEEFIREIITNGKW